MSRVVPTSQLVSRGFLNAPVKNTRAMWTTIAPTKMSQAQWCICRMRRPQRTLKLMLMVDMNAWDTVSPRSGL